jgi:hypothetical protein
MYSIDDTDHFLQRLINSVNGHEKTVPVTILIDGFMVSGNLISGHKYFEQVQEVIPLSGKSATELSPSDYTLEVLIEGQADVYKDLKDSVTNISTYFHMANAKFHNNSGVSITGIKGVTWRGRVDKVSGFYLG